MNSVARLAVVQLAGDYREAVQNFAAGKAETYYAQRYSVDSLAVLCPEFTEVAVICGMTATAYDEVLSNGVRAIGAGLSSPSDSALIQLLESQQPTHLVLRTPSFSILQWAAKHQVDTIATFAESITNRGIRSRVRNFRLARSLNQPQVKWVGSYGIRSSQVLQQLGVKPHKIVPWDFLIDETPGTLPPKSLRQDGKPWTIIYVGSLVPAKGVGDILNAIAQLRSRNFPVNLQIVGEDRTGEFTRQIQQLQIEPFVEFLGIVANQRIEPLMQDADLVVIPSHPTYPEGFPLTIHHALRSRTPLVASDHPMFLTHLKHQKNAIVFPAQDATALANAVAQVLSDAALYHRLSEASYPTWKQLRLPVKWADLIYSWLNIEPHRSQWLAEHCLSSGLYDDYV